MGLGFDYHALTDKFDIRRINANFQKLENAVLISDLLSKVYPVGSIYMSIVNTSPASFLGGTWAVWGTGRVPIGVDTNQTEFNAVEKTGGEKTHALTSNENGPHEHDIRIDGTSTATIGMLDTGGSVTYSMTGHYTGTATAMIGAMNSGSGTPHNNLQPYITCYMWKRIA